jgi:hypothetical protein
MDSGSTDFIPQTDQSDASQVAQMNLPESLQKQLSGFRGYVWSTKLLEAVSLAVLTVLLAYLSVYFFDRSIDTPVAIRWAILAGSILIWVIVPWALHRWVWKHRRADQLARLLRRRDAGIGDQLLSVIELAENNAEQTRSRQLCQAAIQQVAHSANQRDLRRSAPGHWLKPFCWMIAGATGVAICLALFFPAAAHNAWQRFSSPWNPVKRYTFAAISPLPDRMVVPHGEQAPLVVELTEDTAWKPASASVRIGPLVTKQTQRKDEQFYFDLPAQVIATTLELTVGDYYQNVQLDPKYRPELTSIEAQVSFPDYLQRTEPLSVDVRTGILSVVEGSQAVFQAHASRELESVQARLTIIEKPKTEIERLASDQPLEATSASANDSAAAAQLPAKPVVIHEASLEVEKVAGGFATAPLMIQGNESKVNLQWQDHDGLAGKQPFELTVVPLADEAPSVSAQGLPRQAVVLDSEQINFTALAADDFGVKRLGISWRAAEGTLVAEPAQGQKVIAAGGPQESSLQVPATFCASALGISPQPLEVTVFVEDYLPGREAVHSPPYLLYVLTAAEHAVWISNQMTKWQRSAMDVRDTELQLHDANKQLRLRAQTQEGQAELVQQLQRQAALEEANGRKLNSLTNSGAELLRQAARNPEIAVGELDQWAQMLEVLQDIGGNRMPNVADLLKQAAKQAGKPGSAKQIGKQEKSAPQAGQMLANAAPDSAEQSQTLGDENQPKLPSIVDMESSLQPDDQTQPKSAEDSQQKKPGAGRLSLPQTALVGPEKKEDQEAKNEEEQPEQPTPEQLAEALSKQQELLAEFEKIADELNSIMANLEGSTLVKRLKSASREQSMVAEMIASRIENVFGRAREIRDDDRSTLSLLSETEQTCSKSLSFIMDDMQAFYERRRTDEFKAVLDEMKSSEVLGSLQKLSEEIPVEHGLSIAQAEYWADTIDRWAEDLVPADEEDKGEKKKGDSKPKDSMPPRLILELLKILEGEVNLREDTRVAAQAQAAVTSADHATESNRLTGIQRELRQRVESVADEISKLPEAEKNFEAELKLLAVVSGVMDEARALLEFGDVGTKTMAAETEAIELLLQSQRINPKGGGGGGGVSPGGGGNGTTQDSALALIGNGINQLERRERREVGAAVGDAAGRSFPEEFRAGLDAYFQGLESKQ